MKIDLKYFGMIAESIGKIGEIIELPVRQIKLNEFKVFLQEQYPSLELLSYKIAINQIIAEEYALINAGDEIALLPPFAGG